MNRGLEIVRRLLIAALWLSLSAIGLTVITIGIDECINMRPPLENKIIVDDRSHEKNRAYAERWKQYWDNLPFANYTLTDQVEGRQELVEINATHFTKEFGIPEDEIADFVKKSSNLWTEFCRYNSKKSDRTNYMWLAILGSVILCPLIGFFVHRLINWILVHKPSN